MNTRIKSNAVPINYGFAPDRDQRRSEQSAVPSQFQLAAFPTSLGWIGLLGADQRLISVFIGHRSAAALQKIASQTTAFVEQDDWNPPLRRLLEAYSDGEIVDFSDVEISLPETTTFRWHVIAATRQLRYGETASYGELARRVGHAGAARAVGTVMSTNRFPILIPCHRVLAAGGKLGGYTSPAGTPLKQRLLDMEAKAIRDV